MLDKELPLVFREKTDVRRRDQAGFLVEVSHDDPSWDLETSIE